MSERIKIHIFCIKQPICDLIRKTFSSSKYNITCSSGNEANEGLFIRLGKNIDCIIIDKDIKPEIKDKIKKYFSEKPIICLPSLESDNLSEDELEIGETGVKNISEPFRLSELAKTLDEIF